jgi:hypothetical protein
LCELSANDRSSAPTNFGGQKQTRSNAHRIYCAAYVALQRRGIDSFSAKADLLIKAIEDFFDLSEMLQSRHYSSDSHRVFAGV